MGGNAVKRQTLILVAIGVVLFLAGGTIAFASVVNGTKNKTGGTTITAVNTPVVVAKANIPAGTTGQTMVAKGLVGIETISTKQYVSSDLTTLQALTDTVLTTSVKLGHAIESIQLTPSTSSISIPKGDDGMTITLSGSTGLAGYLQPGSDVDVYANVTHLSSGSGQSSDSSVAVPCTELLMSNIDVLDVSSTEPALATNPSMAGGRTVPGSETLLLAVNPSQARILTFMNANESLSVTQTQKSAGTVAVGACIGTGQTTVAP
jgi:Flp pilus assembly protein CpaB